MLYLVFEVSEGVSKFVREERKAREFIGGVVVRKVESFEKSGSGRRKRGRTSGEERSERGKVGSVVPSSYFSENVCGG